MDNGVDAPRDPPGRSERARARGDLPSVPSKAAFKYYEPLARVRQFAHTNLAELSLVTAAKVARLSPKYFSSFFKQHTGMGFRDWVTHLRVQRAKALLTERNRPVTRVALEVGFKDTRTFQRAFKKVTGMTPIAFKKSVAP